jgi:hypothetical protein
VIEYYKHPAPSALWSEDADSIELLFVQPSITIAGRDTTMTVDATGSDQSMEDKMAKLDIIKTNVAVERLLAVTDNPRHRFLLMSYYRHRFLAIAGRYEDIFMPDMLADNPVYHFHALGINAKLVGEEAVKSLYTLWARTDQSILYPENEQVAVADNFIASVATVYQQAWGKALIVNGIEVDDEDAMYIYKAREEMIWSYDDRGRKSGEDVWEPDPTKAEITKLDPADVITTLDAAKLLDPLIKPLPSFGEVVGMAQRAG